MCGIVGIVHRDFDRHVRGDDIRRMCAAVRHRGPDDEGVYVEGPVGLGMRRLSIIDLSGGHQPIFNEDGTKVIVFNGEIYNYRDLRRDLVARGHAVRSHSDTETVLHLYEEMGADCVERLRGMFAFAIWDSTARTLMLARDRFGIKPLYVVRGPWGIAFASELKALHAVGLTSRVLDWEALDTYFHLGYVPAPATPFADVRKLEPGHTLLWRADGEVTVRRYWDLPLERTAEPPNIAARVVEWIDESVGAHLVSDVPLAAFLSGGLDSSAIVSSMATQGPTPHAFTARYHGSGAGATDESGLARTLASRYGAKLTVVDIRPEVRDIFEPVVWALDEPHADDSAIPTWALSRAVASEYKVALTGAGGDELFAGYRRHTAMLLGDYYSLMPRPLRAVASALASRLREPADGSLGVDRLKRFLESGANALPGRFFGYVSRLRNGDRERLYSSELYAHQSCGPTAGQARFESLFQARGSPRGLSGALYLDYKTYLADDILALSDRIAMAHSLEVRVPFVDHVLVDAVFGLPDQVKVRWGRSKHLLRQALRSRLPEPHLRAPKRGFVGPTTTWLRAELRETLEDELSPARMRRLGFFKPSTVSAMLQDHFSRRHNREGILWALLCFSTWHRLYVENVGIAPYAPAARDSGTGTREIIHSA